MKRRLLALCLAAVLLLGGLPARAVSSLDNFRPIRAYDGRFADAVPGDWYYDYVVRLYCLGLAEGRSEDRFGADRQVTVEETAVFAARIRSVYDTGSPEAGPAAYPQTGRWSAPYISYLRALGGIDPELENHLTAPATRAQAAGLLARALPKGTLPEINGAVVTQAYAMGRRVTDVTAYTPYQQEILSLYKWGVLEGADELGSYYPDQPILRRELAAILVRLVDEETRLTIDWDLRSGSHSAAGTTLADLVTDSGVLRSRHGPEDAAAIDGNLRWMLARGGNTLSLYPEPQPLSGETAERLMQRYLDGARGYIEQGYNAVNCSAANAAGGVTLTFYSSIFSGDNLTRARTEAMEAAVEVHDRLWQEGHLAETMTETEKARVYFAWLAENCAYDYSAGDNSPSHTAYGLFRFGQAVCDGYTAAYNMLLKLEGISCTTASAGDHIWTVAELDGKRVHSDATWGDQGDYIAYQYFSMTEARALGRF